MAPICEFCHFDYIDRTDHSDCGPDAEETTVTESWAPIPDSTHYEVSDLGNVRSVTHTSIASNGVPRTIEGKPIARLMTENGSPYVSIRRDGATKPTNRRVAALMLTAHVGPAPAGARPRVINGDRTDLRLANLEWAGPTPPKPKTPRVPRATMKRPAAVRVPRPPKPAPPTEAVIDLTGLPMMSPNGRPNHFARARDTHTIRHSVAWRARAAHIPTGLDHLTIEYHYRPAEDRYAWDTRNLASAGIWKAAQDALHAHRGRNTAGARGPKHPIVHDDSPGFMTEVGPTQHPAVKGEPAAAWLVIRWDNDEQKVS